MENHEKKSWKTMSNYFVESFQLCNDKNLGQFMKLTNRERQVVELIGRELTTEQIATRMHVSVVTIETHRRNILKKMGVQSVVGLVKEAIKNGWVKLDNQL